LKSYFEQWGISLKIPLDDTADGKYVTVHMSCVAKLFEATFSTCQELLEMTWRAVSDSPYQSLLLYTDDVVPGNVLKPNNPRKFLAVYVAMELWATQLHHEELWIPIAMVQHSQLKKLRGGVSELIARVMKECLLSADNGLATVGLVLGMERVPRRLLLVDHVSLIQDDGALKYVLDVKGAAGLRCCHLCANVTPVSSGLAECDAYFVDLRCTDQASFVPNTNEAMWDTAAELAPLRLRLKPTPFEHEETLRGINYNPHGILLCAELRPYIQPVTASLYDPLHVWWSSGLVQYELDFFLHKLRLHANRRKLPLRFIDLRNEYAAWQFPSGEQTCKSTVEKLFADAREEHFRGSASEMVIAITFLEHFLLDKAPPLDELKNECACFYALVETCRLVTALKFGGDRRVLLPRLEAAIVKHTKLFSDVYGANKLKPKHHQQLHVLLQMRTPRVSAQGRPLPPMPYIDCFSAERKNKKAKASAERITDADAFGRTALATIVNDQFHRLRTLTFREHLEGKVENFPELGANMHKAKAMRSNGARFSRGDIVERAGDAFQVSACASSERGEHFLVVQQLALVNRFVRTSTWQLGAARIVALPMLDGPTRRFTGTKK